MAPKNSCDRYGDMRHGNTIQLDRPLNFHLPQEAVREQTHHVIAVRWQVHRLVHRHGKIVSKVAPVTEVADPLGSAIKRAEEEDEDESNICLINREWQEEY